MSYIPAIPSPECPMRNRIHGEHNFRVFGTMSGMDGAHVDCPGKEMPRRETCIYEFCCFPAEYDFRPLKGYDGITRMVGLCSEHQIA